MLLQNAPATTSSSQEPVQLAVGELAHAAASSSMPETSTPSSIHAEGSLDPGQAAPVLQAEVPEAAIEGGADQPDGRSPAADSIAAGAQEAGPSSFRPDRSGSLDQMDSEPTQDAQEQHGSAQLDEMVHQGTDLLQQQGAGVSVQALRIPYGGNPAGQMSAGHIQQGESSPSDEPDASNSHPGASIAGPSTDQELAVAARADMPEASDVDVMEDELQEGMEGEEPDQEEAQEGADDLLEPMTDDSDQQVVISSHEPSSQEADAEVDIST